MEIHFYHGRDSIDQDMNDDWGFDGPILYDVDVQWTYGFVKFWNDNNLHHLVVDGDLIPIDGKYYGDFNVMKNEEYNYVSQYSKIQHLSLEEFIKLNK